MKTVKLTKNTHQKISNLKIKLEQKTLDDTINYLAIYYLAGEKLNDKSKK